MTEFVFFDYPLPSDPEIRSIWDQISALRHEVYASELQQYQVNSEQQLEDPGHHFIACMVGGKLAGYISLNPPNTQPFRVSKYFSQETLDETLYSKCGERLSSTYEVRALTVSPEYRGKQISAQLMAYALKFVLQVEGTDIVAMGHANVVELYKKIGMTVFEQHGIQYGETLYYPMYLDPQIARTMNAEKISEFEEDEDVCYHGGKSWDTSKFDFGIRDTLVVADVLDSPFPPCPEALHVLREQLERCCQESPPTQCEELIETIAETRGVQSKHVAVSSGSSSLMFSFLPQLLTSTSKVLVLSPMYGEYSHILTHVIGCEMTNFVLHKENGFEIDADELIRQARQHDAVILVNPNSPTGVYCSKMSKIVHQIQDESNSPTRCKMIWVDETYIDYIPEAQSLESLVDTNPSLIVCKSMSKCYALSGLRVAYAVSQKVTELRRFIPPWAVSLPGQLAAVAALKNPTYYNEQYEIIHQQRTVLSDKLREQNFTVLPGVANFILTFLPEETQHTSSTFIEACKEKGVFIRDAQNMGVTLGNNSVRFAIRSSGENERIIECVKEVLSQQ
ncbi:MAG: aminotransferase class I/II-fold pyridoxal phosphate-dependent enzyme [Euryarchaeota archaeon TMED99]|nr:MAG: aminotransferase class I/II-fold pyridoxal phosphate-dependent enzyme [Euryarchaeota archaeon TMED99]